MSLFGIESLDTFDLFDDDSKSSCATGTDLPESLVGENGHHDAMKYDFDDKEEKELKEFVYDELLDEVILGLVFEIHRSVKIGTFFLADTDPEGQKQYQIVDEKGLDVFGQPPIKNNLKMFDCVCPNCQRNLAASRFAPHLEKCMGMGRNSSRLASKRIANTGKNDSDNEENDNDDDWNYGADRKARVKRRERNNQPPRRPKASKLRYGEIPSGSSDPLSSQQPIPTAQVPSIDPLQMGIDETKSLLMHSCGVISEHTKKMCTRSHRCPQHSEEQRKAVRIFLLGPQGASQLEAEEIHVDIDTCDDVESQSFRDSLQWEGSNQPSPADSTSTVNSTNSRKSKKTKSSKRRNMHTPTPVEHL